MTKRKNEDFNFTYRLGAFSLLGFLLLVMAGQIKRTEPRRMLPEAPVVEAQEVIPEVSPTPTPVLSEKEQIIQEINQVFGVDADKAFLILQGKECAENRTLNPLAKNDNTIWGGVGIDRGIFQISSYYHPSVSDECAYDFKCNTAYAHKLFKARGNFSAWTCGRHYGI